MTIHELANALRMQKVDIPFNSVRGPFEHFPIHETDVLISEDGETFLGINRVTGKFVAQRSEFCLISTACVELNVDEVARLTGRIESRS